MPILNYTTSISISKTTSEIQEVLFKAGAKRIIFDSADEKTAFPVQISFVINWMNKDVLFVMPCRYRGVLKAMQKDKKVPRRLCTDEQAVKVGWRILKVWIEAQLAIVESEMAELAEVFLPYAVDKQGRTLFDSIGQNNGQNLLEN